MSVCAVASRSRASFDALDALELLELWLEREGLLVGENVPGRLGAYFPLKR